MFLLFSKTGAIKIGALPSPGLSYRKDHYIANFNRKYGDHASLDDLCEFLDSLCSTHKKKSICSTACAFKRAIKNKLGDKAEHPFVKMKLDRFTQRYHAPKHSETKYALSIEEVRNFIKLADSKVSIIAEFLFHTAMRASELTRLEWSSCRQLASGKWLLKFEQKGKRYNEIEVRDAVMQKVKTIFKGEKYLFERKPGVPYDYSRVYYLLKSRSERLLGYKITPHDMRRAFATHMVQIGKPIKGIMKRMGSTCVEVFMRHYVWIENLELKEIPSVSDFDSPDKEQKSAESLRLSEKPSKKVDAGLSLHLMEEKQGLLFFRGFDNKPPIERQRELSLVSIKRKQKLNKHRRLINQTFSHAS